MNARILGPAYAQILVRELERLVRQVEGYPDEADLWRTSGSVKNSAGTLALHLAGNLEHFVGTALGGTGYVRDREGEFGDRDVPRDEIVRRIRACQATMRDTLTDMDDATLLAAYPAQAPASLGDDVATATFLTHLIWHLGWHLGQIDYHRRMLVGGEAV
jgi:hypothetical protein